MPMLLRAAHVDEVPDGTSRVVKVRGTKLRLAHVGGTWAAYDARTAPMAAKVTEADLEWARRNGAVAYRTVVRGSHVHVALEAEPQSAPASVLGREGAPQPLGAVRG